MRTNYLNLKKIFLTFDRHLDGFISLEDLKSILCQFTVPMSDQLFRQMMERCVSERERRGGACVNFQTSEVHE